MAMDWIERFLAKKRFANPSAARYRLQQITVNCATTTTI
jgi:hypothetical protein